MRLALLILAVCTGAWSGAIALADTGVTAADYHVRALHAPTPEKRLELLNKALVLNPRHVPALRHRARVRLAMGEKELALADRVRAADLRPEEPAVNDEAATLARELKQYEEAARLYARAVAMAPRNVPVRAGYIEVLTQLLRTDEAIAQADVLVRRHPEQDFPYLLRVRTYEWGDRFEEAVRDLTVLVERHPNSPDYYLQRCTSYRGMAEGRKALADAEKALRLHGPTAYAYNALGCCHELLGEFDKALDDYRRAAELGDDDKRFRAIWMCLLLRKMGRRDDADRLIRDFLEDFDDEEWIAPVLRYLGGEMTEEEVFEKAQDDDAYTQRQQLCEAYYYVGAAHLADGNLDRAEELFRKCLEQRVHNYYEHGFALRDLRVLKKRREELRAEEGGSE